MDGLNRKILYEIVENARDSHKRLAKNIRISREVFDYRIKKLSEDGIIMGYQPRLNLLFDEHNQFYIILLQTTSIVDERNLVENIKKNHRTIYIEKLGGIYNYLIGFFSNKPVELAQYVNFIDDILGETKLSLTIFTILEELKDTQKPLFDIKFHNCYNIKSIESNIENQVLDKIDKQIIQLLLIDATLSSAYIANNIGISAVAIRKRIKRLIERKVIMGFRTIVNLFKLNYQINNLLIKINANSKEIKQRWNNFIYNNNQIIYAAKIGGEYDYFLCIVNKNNKELEQFLNSIKTNFVNIKEFNIIPVFDNLLHQYRLN